MERIIRKNYGMWIAIVAVLIAVALVVSVVLIIALHRAVSQPRIPIENGVLVTKYASGTFHIFLEDSAPPTLNSHPFTFINTETQARVFSRPPTITRTYSLNAMTVGGEVRRGTFGRIVATVQLEAGTYIVEFPRIAGTGVFVWGNDVFRTIVTIGIPMAAVAIVLSLSIPGLLILIDDRREQKKRQLEDAALTGNMQVDP